MALCDFNKLIEALTVAPVNRSKGILDDIKGQLDLTDGMKKLNQELDSPFVTEACAMTMEICTYAPNEAIIQTGEHQKTFCMMLSGIGAIVIPNHLMSLRTSISGKRFSELKIRQNFSSRLGLGGGIFKTEPEQIPYSAVSPGDGLGLNAFHEESTNMISVYSKKHSIIASTSAVKLKQLLAKISEEAHQAKVEFLKSLPGFSQFTYSYISRLSSAFKERAYSLNQVIYREGAKCEALYAIKTGFVEFSKEKLSKERGVPNKLYIKSAGDIFGEQDLLLGPTHLSTAISTTGTTILYILPIDIFRDLIAKTKLASQLASRSNELQAFYTSREQSTFSQDPSPRIVSGKLAKTYSRQGGALHAKLLSDLNRKYNKYNKVRLKEPSSFRRNLSPLDIGLKSKTFRSPLSNETSLMMSTKSVKNMLKGGKNSLTGRSSSMLRGTLTNEVSPRTRLKSILRQQW